MKTHLDLCAGIGGFSLASGWAGYTTVGFCEIDPFCQLVLRKHWPEVPIHDDLRTLTADAVRGWAEQSALPDASSERRESVSEPASGHERDEWRTPLNISGPTDRTRIGLLTAGYPCQPFSQAGKRLGEEDDRHLWPAIAALVAELQPAQCLFENVAGHITLGLDRVLADLEAIGYACGTVVVPACAVNAPHRRDRIWVMAHADHERIDRSRTPRNRRDESQDGDIALGHADLRSVEGFGPRRVEVIRARHEEPQLESTGAFKFDTWAVEPELGRSVDGFSRWLDGRGLMIPHELYSAYGETNLRPSEILRALRDANGTSAVRGAIGGSIDVPPTPVLFAYLCQLEAIATDEARLQFSSTEASETRVRCVRSSVQSPSSPYRSGHHEQRTDECADALYALSRLLAHDAEEAWLAYRRSNAFPHLNPWSDGWEDGLPRVATGVPHRMDRLRSLGNSIVPQVAYEIILAMGVAA